MNWAWIQILKKHGWRQSQHDGSWFREYDNKQTEFVAGDYIPKYKREVNRLLRK